MWVVQIPAVEERVGISHATLGGLLVLLGLGAFVGMQVAGRLADRFGTRTVVPATGVLCAATLVLPGLARDPWSLAGALLVFGFGNGCLDVSMNAHAVHVEKAYDRPVMSAFHATFSVGGVVAALVGAGAASTGMSPAATLGAVGAVGVVTALVSARVSCPLRRRPPPTPRRSRSTGSEAAHRARAHLDACHPGLDGHAVRGSRQRLGALHLKNILDAPASTAAFAYGTYAATMPPAGCSPTASPARFGPMAVLRYGSAMAAAGITIVAVSPWIWAAFAGWALFGLGLSGCVPQLFSAAGTPTPPLPASTSPAWPGSVTSACSPAPRSSVG